MMKFAKGMFKVKFFIVIGIAAAVMTASGPAAAEGDAERQDLEKRRIAS